MTYLRPGVYVEETLNPIPPVVGPNSTSVAAFIGAAKKGPLTPTLVTSWSQYTTLFGSWNSTDNTLATAVYLFFANGGSSAYILRVVGSGAAASALTLLDRTSGSPVDTLTLTAKSVGVWGNSLSVTITNSVITGYFDLTLKLSGTVVERFTDLTMKNDDARYAPTVITAGSSYVVATDASPSDSHTATDNPALISDEAIDATAGADGTAPNGGDLAAATSGLDTVLNSLVLNVPGVTAATDVNDILAYAEARDDVFVVIDGLNDTVANQLTRSAAYTSTSLGAVYYPLLTIPSPTNSTPGATVTANPGGAVVGQIVATDASRGVFKAPAGLGSRIAGAVSVAKLTNAELDSLNTAVAPVNAIRYVPGSGIVIMGARTLKPGYSDRYVPVRRSLIYLRKAMTDLTQFAIFEPNDFRLWRRINASLEAFLTDFWQQGGLRGATPADSFFIKVDAENNPISLVDNGEVHIEVGVALQRPAEFVVIRISQYDSGAVVTVS